MPSNTSSSIFDENKATVNVYTEFKSAISEISKKFNIRETTIIKSLIDNTCDHRARNEIESPKYVSAHKFDSYFRMKHDFEKNRFVQLLALELRHQGLQASISIEGKGVVGVYDVLIANGKSLVSISDKGGKKIVVEWKSGAGLSLSQLERYLFECSILVLVRVQMNQVVRIARSDIGEHLKRSLVSLTERAQVVEAGENLQKIPGPYCKGCPVDGCEFRKEISTEKMVSFASESMEADLLSVFKNVDGCIDQAIKIVLDELAKKRDEA